MDLVDSVANAALLSIQAAQSQNSASFQFTAQMPNWPCRKVLVLFSYSVSFGERGHLNAQWSCRKTPTHIHTLTEKVEMKTVQKVEKYNSNLVFCINSKRALQIRTIFGWLSPAICWHKSLLNIHKTNENKKRKENSSSRIPASLLLTFNAQSDTPCAPEPAARLQKC